jgi:hypothetical protein
VPFSKEPHASLDVSVNAQLLVHTLTDRRPRTLFPARLTSGAFLPAAHRTTLLTKASRLIDSANTSAFHKTNVEFGKHLPLSALA